MFINTESRGSGQRHAPDFSERCRVEGSLDGLLRWTLTRQTRASTHLSFLVQLNLLLHLVCIHDLFFFPPSYTDSKSTSADDTMMNYGMLLMTAVLDFQNKRKQQPTYLVAEAGDVAKLGVAPFPVLLGRVAQVVQRRVAAAPALVAELGRHVGRPSFVTVQRAHLGQGRARQGKARQGKETRGGG